MNPLGAFPNEAGIRLDESEWLDTRGIAMRRLRRVADSLQASGHVIVACAVVAEKRLLLEACDDVYADVRVLQESVERLFPD